MTTSISCSVTAKSQAPINTGSLHSISIANTPIPITPKPLTLRSDKTSLLFMESRGRKVSRPSSGRQVMSPPWETVGAASAWAEGESSGVVDTAAATGGRPYFECHICKNGFSTKQALGGHMNRHRRDSTRRADSDRDHDTHTGIARRADGYCDASTGMATAAAASQITGEGYGGQYHYQYQAYPPAPPMGCSFGVHYPVAPSAAEFAVSTSPWEPATHGHGLSLGGGWNEHGSEGSSVPGGSEWQAAIDEPGRDQLDLELRLGWY